MAGIGVANMNLNEQRNNQINNSIQEDLQAITNNTEQQNIQDYTTFIRETNRNLQEMKTSLNASLKSVMNVVARNEANFTGCGLFNDVDFDQSVNLSLKLEQGVEALQKTAETLKNSAKMISTTETTTNQGSSSDTSAGTSSKQNIEQKQENEQGSEQENFTRFSPLRMLEGFNGLLKTASSRTHKMVERFTKPKHIEKYAFCLGCFNYNENIQTNDQINNARQVSQKVLENNTKIANKISSAYNKVAEILNEFKETQEKNSEANSSMNITAENIINAGTNPELQLKMLEINPTFRCTVFNGKFEGKQKIEVEASLILKGAINQMSSTDVDNETAAMMADMMGLIQTADSTTSSTATSSQGIGQGQSNKQTNKQSNATDWTTIIIIIGAIAVVCIMLKGMSGSSGQGCSLGRWYEEHSNRGKTNDQRQTMNEQPTPNKDKAATNEQPTTTTDKAAQMNNDQQQQMNE